MGRPKKLIKDKPISEPLPQKILLRVSEVARYFDVTDKTVYLWIQHGHLEIENTPGGQMRVTKNSVDKCRFRSVNGDSGGN